MGTDRTTDAAGSGLVSAVLTGSLRRRADGGRILPFAPSAFDVEILAAVEAAVARDIPFGVVLPLPGTTAAVLIGAAALVGAVVRTRDLSVRVAVVSSTLTSRTLYDELYFQDQRLSDFIPRGTVDLEGVGRVVGRPTRDAGGRLYLVNHLSRLECWTERLDGLVVDASAATPDALDRIVKTTKQRGPVTYLTADPLDPALDRIRGVGGLIWGWDSSCVAELAVSANRTRGTDAGPLVAGLDVLAAAGASRVTVLTHDSGDRSALDDALAALWRALGHLSAAYRATRRSAFGAAQATQWVWGVYNTLTSLPVSPDRYDAHVGASPYAVRVGEAVSTARAYARNVGGEAGDHWYAVADAIADVLVAARRAEKFAQVSDWVTERVDASGPGLLVARNQAAASALTAALDESPLTPARWRDTVAVTTIADLTSGRTRTDGASAICLLGPLPRSRAGLLALPPARELYVVAAGPFEASRSLRQAVAARAALAAIREEVLNRSAPALAVSTGCPSLDVRPASEAVRLLASGRPTPAADTSLLSDADSPWEPFDADVVAMLQRTIAVGGGLRDDVQGVAPARVGGTGATAIVPALVVYLRNGSQENVLLLGPNDLITRRRGGTVERVAAKSLAPEDAIVLVDHAARHDLFTLVTEKLSESPAYGSLAALVSFWHARAARLRDGNLTYREIHERMTGTSITTEQTIGNWIRGEVDGPLDPDDVGRFAAAVRDHELRDEAQRVGWALRTLHRVHRKIGHWLSAQISGAYVRPEETFVDAELGIRVSDLLESVTTHVVSSIDRDQQTSPSAALGVVLTPSEAFRLLRSAG
jgi:hypothetical protein